MTQPGRYAASDGSFAKSASSAAARGGVLIGIAVLIGAFLLWQGFDGGDASADTSAGGAVDDGGGDAGGDGATTTVPEGTDATTTTAAGDDSSTTVPGDDTATTTTAGAAVDPPSEVNVLVLNGTGEAGLAGNRRDALTAVGYVVTTANVPGFTAESSFVYYKDGYADEAKAVAEALSGPAGVVAAAPADVDTLSDDAEAAAAANVIVVLGADGSLS